MQLILHNRLKHKNFLYHRNDKDNELWFLNFLMGNLRAYGGCLDLKRR